MWWDQEQVQVDVGPCRAAYGKQHRRYCRAIEADNRAGIHKHENWLLKSHAAKTLALVHAAKKKKYPLYPAKLEVMASTLSCWEEPPGMATFYGKKKSDGDLRGIFNYRVMQAAQQYLVWWTLAPRIRLHHGQYAVAGRDRTAAVEKAKQLIPDGYEWVIRGDIKDCYPSMDGEKVLELLPGPRAVLRQVILPPFEQHLHYYHKHAALLSKVRRGLPQGAASTALVAAAALVPVLNELPDDVVPILYVDDFAILARSKAAAVNTMNTLQKALRASPVGNLRLKMCNIHHVDDGFGFLGYSIFRNASGGATARPREAALESLYEKLEAFDPNTSSDPLRDKLNKVISWRCAYAAWEGGDSTDDVLFAALSNHFPVDWLDEELIPFLHSKAQITRKKCLPA